MLKHLTLVAGLAIAVVLSIEAVWKPAQCNRLAATVERRTRTALEVDGISGKRLAERNLRELREGLEECPSDLELWMMTGANQQVLQRWNDAARSYRTLLRSSKRPEIYFNYGKVLWRSGERERGTEVLLHAVRTDPGLLNDLDDPAMRYATEEALHAGEEDVPR
jgi:cytochrome c-type biogenesis protein CcmH/NrfG